MKAITQKIWWPFLKNNKANAVIITLLGFVNSYCTLLLPLSIGKYLEISFHSGAGKTKALQLLGISLPDSISLFFLFFSCLLVVKLLSGWAYQYKLAMFGELFIASHRKQLFSHHLEKKQTETLPASTLLAYSSDAKSLQQMLGKGVLGLIKDILFLSTGFYVLLLLQQNLTCFVLLVIILFWYLQRWFTQKQKHVFAEKRKRQGSLLNVVSQSLIISDDTTTNAAKIFQSKSYKLHMSLTQYHLHKTLLKETAPFMLYFLLGIVMYLFYTGKQNSLLQTGDVIAYLLLLMTLFSTVRNIIKIEYTWLQGELSAKKFGSVINEPEKSMLFKPSESTAQ